MKKYQSPSWHKEGEKDGERGNFSDRVSYQWKKDYIMKPAKS